jgi:hypothetical protein
MDFAIVPPELLRPAVALNGEFSAARRYHQNNVRHLIEFAWRGIPIVGTSTSCI